MPLTPASPERVTLTVGAGQIWLLPTVRADVPPLEIHPANGAVVGVRLFDRALRAPVTGAPARALLPAARDDHAAIGLSRVGHDGRAHDLQVLGASYDGHRCWSLRYWWPCTEWTPCLGLRLSWRVAEVDLVIRLDERELEVARRIPRELLA